MAKFIVPIIFRGQDNFIVEADTAEDAATKATELFNSGAQPDEFGNEWQEIEDIGEVEQMPDESA